MRLRNISLSFTYSFGQIILGLLLHPFQTMFMLWRDKYWLWTVFAPLGFLIAAIVLWEIISFILVSFLGAIVTLVKHTPSLLFSFEVLKWWVFYFCFIWQFVLLGLLVKFYLFFRNKKEKSHV